MCARTPHQKQNTIHVVIVTEQSNQKTRLKSGHTPIYMWCVWNFSNQFDRKLKCVCHIWFDLYFLESATLAMLIHLRRWDISHVMLLTQAFLWIATHIQTHRHTHIHWFMSYVVATTLLKLGWIFQQIPISLKTSCMWHIFYGDKVL